MKATERKPNARKTKQVQEQKTMAGLPVLQKPEPAQEGLIVMELYVENIKKVRLVHWKPGPGLNVVHGEEGNGKSSLRDGIIWGLEGLSTTTAEPIRKGERVATIKMNLSNKFIVTRYFTRVDPDKSKKGKSYFAKLLIERYNKDPHEGALENPQTLLNDFMSHISFDPLAFTRMDDDEQMEELRKLVTFDLDMNQLEKDQLEDYKARTLKGQLFDVLKARLAAATAPEDGLPETAINTQEITKRLEGAANHNNIVAASVRQQQDLRRLAEAAAQDATDFRVEAAELRRRADALEERATASVDFGAQKIAAADAMVIAETIDTAAVAAELQAATATNNAIADAARYRRLKDEFDQVEAEWTALDESYKERGRQREAAIARAKMPIDGLGIRYDEPIEGRRQKSGEVLYNGLPFSQASNSERIRVSVALAMAANPLLRIMAIKDGSLIGAKSMQMIHEMAEEKHFQIFMERLTGVGKTGVLMEDGEATGEDVVV